MKLLRASVPVYLNPYDYPQRRFVSYIFASIFALIFGIFFWFHTARWRILGFYVVSMIIVYFLSPAYCAYWPLILLLYNAYFAIMAPRICHERWKARGYRIADDSYDQIPDLYIKYLKFLYKAPSFGLF